MTKAWQRQGSEIRTTKIENITRGSIRTALRKDKTVKNIAARTDDEIASAQQSATMTIVSRTEKHDEINAASKQLAQFTIDKQSGSGNGDKNSKIVKSMKLREY